MTRLDKGRSVSTENDERVEVAPLTKRFFSNDALPYTFNVD
jgi:hypothetical protein